MLTKIEPDMPALNIVAATVRPPAGRTTSAIRIRGRGERARVALTRGERNQRAAAAGVEDAAALPNKAAVLAAIKAADDQPSVIPTSVTEAVVLDLEELAERDPILARSAQAATAIALARELDSENSATSKSMCARALSETMDRLRELAPAEQKKDGVDDLSATREKRRQGKSAAKG